MTNPAHILETAALVLVAYLLGCVLAYGARRALYAWRSASAARPVVAPVTLPVEAATRRVPTPAARLARASADDEAPVPLAPTPLSVPKPVPVQAEVAAKEPAPVQRTAKAPSKPKVAAKAKAKGIAAKPKPAPVPKAEDPKPAALLRPRRGKADDLKQIKGIGPKIEASLNTLGIYHFDQIAAWTKLNTDWVDGQLAFKGRIRREQWIEQAIELTKK